MLWYDHYCSKDLIVLSIFFFQAEDGIRDQPRSRGLGDVYKRQDYKGIYRQDTKTYSHKLRLIRRVF